MNRERKREMVSTLQPILYDSAIRRLFFFVFFWAVMKQ